MSFEEWMRELRRLMIEKWRVAENIEQAERYGSDEDWRSYFDGGYMPDEALLEDFSYAD